MAKLSGDMKVLLVGVLFIGVLLLCYHQPKRTPPASPPTAEELKRREEIALLYPPNALKDPLEYDYKSDMLVRYDFAAALKGEMLYFLSAIADDGNRVMLSPVLTRKAVASPGHESYWKAWAIRLFGEGGFYRKLGYHDTRGTWKEDPQYEAENYITRNWYSFPKKYMLKALALNDPMTWYYFALSQFGARWEGGEDVPELPYDPSDINNGIIDSTASAERNRKLPDMTPFEAMKKAAELGAAPAQLWVGDVYCLGIDTRDPEDIKRGYAHELIEVNPELAMRYRQQALDSGEREALYNIAMSYFHGTCLPKNKTLALAYLSAYGGSPLVRQDLYDSLSEEERQKARSKTIELADKLAAVREQRRKEEREHYRQWLRDMRADAKANQDWLKWALLPRELYERIKPELIQAALDKGLAQKDEDGKVFAVREITWAEYMEMDRENRVRKWEALSEEEKKTYPRPE